MNFISPSTVVTTSGPSANLFTSNHATRPLLALPMSLAMGCSVVTVGSGGVRRVRSQSIATSKSTDRRVIESRGRKLTVNAYKREGADTANDEAKPAEVTVALRAVRSSGKITATVLAFAASAVVLAPISIGDPMVDGFINGAPSAAAHAAESPIPSIEVPTVLDPWKDGRARKAAERRLAAQNVDKAFQKEAEQRAENERLSTAYYAKAGAARRARAACERDGLPAPECDLAAQTAGALAFDTAVVAISDEEIELDLYEQRQKELRATAEIRNAEALLAAEQAEAEAKKLEATEQELLSLQKECVGADSPLKEPGSVVCT